MRRKGNGIERRTVLGWSVGGAVGLELRIVYNDTATTIRKTAELKAIG